MQEFKLLYNQTHPRSAEILYVSLERLVKEVLNKDLTSYKIQIEDHISPFLNEEYYKSLIRGILSIKSENCMPLIADTQTLLAYERMIKALYQDGELKKRIEETLGAIDLLELEKSFVFAPKLILENGNFFEEKQNIGKWRGFKCAFVVEGEVADYLELTKIVEILEWVSGLSIKIFKKNCYDYLLNHNKELAFKMAGKDYYEMVDCGVDFILTPSIGHFEMYDGYAKEIKKSQGRDDLEVPVLFIPEILLAPLKGGSFLLFDRHNITPKMV
ncbi:hypothetical protein [Helicobacter burdigaliensis]|uniref:HdrB C-terminal domain-containing protein n=1 Tax=Helicobacter burdigaliensis TaxID=2315334 RepID=UPI000EF650E4|nr:hypothetical protein [Helicobacter burdigaliensis]